MEGLGDVGCGLRVPVVRAEVGGVCMEPTPGMFYQSLDGGRLGLCFDARVIDEVTMLYFFAGAVGEPGWVWSNFDLAREPVRGVVLMRVEG